MRHVPCEKRTATNEKRLDAQLDTLKRNQKNRFLRTGLCEPSLRYPPFPVLCASHGEAANIALSQLRH